jgi:hypothetical protein
MTTHITTGPRSRGGARRQRAITRTVHIAVGLVLGTYVYAPAHIAEPLQIWLQVIGIPAVVITGVVMWQQGRLRRLTRRLRGGAVR